MANEYGIDLSPVIKAEGQRALQQAQIQNYLSNMHRARSVEEASAERNRIEASRAVELNALDQARANIERQRLLSDQRKALLDDVTTILPQVMTQVKSGNHGVYDQFTGYLKNRHKEHAGAVDLLLPSSTNFVKDGTVDTDALESIVKSVYDMSNTEKTHGTAGVKNLFTQVKLHNPETGVNAIATIPNTLPDKKVDQRISESYPGFNRVEKWPEAKAKYKTLPSGSFPGMVAQQEEGTGKLTLHNLPAQEPLLPVKTATGVRYTPRSKAIGGEVPVPLQTANIVNPETGEAIVTTKEGSIGGTPAFPKKPVDPKEQAFLEVLGFGTTQKQVPSKIDVNPVIINAKDLKSGEYTAKTTMQFITSAGKTKPIPSGTKYVITPEGKVQIYE